MCPFPSIYKRRVWVYLQNFMEVSGEDKLSPTLMMLLALFDLDSRRIWPGADGKEFVVSVIVADTRLKPWFGLFRRCTLHLIRHLCHFSECLTCLTGGEIVPPDHLSKQSHWLLEQSVSPTKGELEHCFSVSGENWLHPNSLNSQIQSCHEQF